MQNTIITYPRELNIIFHTLIQHNLKPVIVGGFVRDSLLHITSKDIDVEVYNLSNYEQLETILHPFGKINSVGKSFGVCKLSYKGLDIDFSMPRHDSKIGNTHTDFHIQTYSHLTFQEAASRRDFTINAIGYDIKTQKLLDPYNGIDDLEHKILRVVDEKKFGEDPLRVLRAMQFCARFELKISQSLLFLAKKMVQQHIFLHLPKERIFTEFEKLFIKAKRPSLGLLFLQEIGGCEYFCPSMQHWKKKLYALDTILEKRMEFFFTLLYFDISQEKMLHFCHKFTNDKKLLQAITLLHSHIHIFSSLKQQDITKKTLYHIANEVCIKDIVLLNQALKLNETILQNIEIKAKELGVWTQKLPPLLQGRDLIEYGLTPSKAFQKILKDAYEAQMDGKFHSIEGAKKWLEEYLLL